MENITLTVDKDYLEQLLDRKFTDTQWVTLKEEMEDALNFYFDDELPRILDELEN
jgi:hypothetical protein